MPRLDTAVLCLLAAFETSAQAPTAPSADRIGFPTGYERSFTKLLTFDRADNGQIRVIWGNDLAAKTPWWEEYPYGSVLLFESWTSQRDASGNLVFDENGRLKPVALATIFVQKKDRGFGAEYGPLRNGEWEYVAYRPDASYQTRPDQSASCASCHMAAGGGNDFVFRRREFFTKASGAAPQALISRYLFLPGEITVKKGSLVTWYNEDEVDHQINIPVTGQHSEPMAPKASFAARMNETGDFEVRCTIHAGMRMRIKVVE